MASLSSGTARDSLAAAAVGRRSGGPIWAERGVVSQEYEKSAVQEELRFQTDGRCEVKDLRILALREKRESAMRREPINLLSLGHTREQTLYGCTLGYKIDQIKCCSHR